jgi:hypothetical protein
VVLLSIAVRLALQQTMIAFHALQCKDSFAMSLGASENAISRLLFAALPSCQIALRVTRALMCSHVH